MLNHKNFFMAALLIFALIFSVTAEAGIVRDKLPLKCYVAHRVTSYDKNSGQSVGWIDAEVDLVTITGIGDNGVAIGTHPGSGGKIVERLFWARDVFADENYANRNVRVNGSHQVFRTRNSGNTIGSISNEEVTVVADDGNRAQIIYRLDNGTGYKMGWVPSSIVRGDGGGGSTLGGDWENKIGQKLANENSEHYTKPTNPFNKSYTSQRDGSYHATNCTWYAWGRMREVTGRSLSVWGNAGDWHNQTSWDSNLTSKCIAERTTEKGGHVVFVEYVDNNNGRVYYTECNWNVRDDYKVQVTDINTFKSKFKWFIH